MKRYLLVFILLQNLSFAKDNDTIPLIEIDASGEERVVEMEKKDYVNGLYKTSSTVHDSMLDAFNKLDSGPNMGWHIRTFIFALATQVELGAGPFKVGVLPRVKFYFTNSTTPSTP